MLRLFIVFIILLPFTGLAQYTICGKVISLADKKPIAGASVFLNNATVGATTADNGTYTLTNVRPGQYDLVISIVGYETFHHDIIVNNDVSLPPIEISPKTIALKEAAAATTITFAEQYAYFDYNGIILNPRSVIFDGFWGKSLIPELLPVDHVPLQVK